MDPDARTATTSTHRTTVDGVPARWADLTTDPTTTLAFGVGIRDLDPTTAGITHLVEHLVMRRVGRVRYPVNAESSLGSTSFYVTGTPAQTTEFLGLVCDAVRDLAVNGVGDADLEAERRTVSPRSGRTGSTAPPTRSRTGTARAAPARRSPRTCACSTGGRTRSSRSCGAGSTPGTPC